MISKYLGEDVFMSGIRRYLKKHAYGSTQTEDLWAALSEESGKDISKIASIWTKKTGYPILTAKEDGNEITLYQNRFLSTGDVKPFEDETLYWIPLLLKTSDQNGKPVMDGSLVTIKRKTSVTLPVESQGVFKLNGNHSGIYRVAYSPEQLKKLGSMTKTHPNFLSIEDRAGLVADIGSLCFSGCSKTTDLLNLITAWKDEEEFMCALKILC
jgi:aminopeptidase 2